MDSSMTSLKLRKWALMSHYGDLWNHLHERALANGLDQCVELHALCMAPSCSMATHTSIIMYTIRFEGEFSNHLECSIIINIPLIPFFSACKQLSCFQNVPIILIY